MSLKKLLTIIKNYKKMAFTIACAMSEIADDIGIEKPHPRSILDFKNSNANTFYYVFYKKISTPAKSLDYPQDVSRFLYKAVPKSKYFIINFYEFERFFVVEIKLRRGVKK